MNAVALVEQLTELAERQRAAAVRFDVAEVEWTTQHRADTLFELKVALERGLGPDETAQVREALPAYQRAEARLAKVVGTVARALEPPAERVSTYGRRGALRLR
jgi:hypothetical protein